MTEPTTTTYDLTDELFGRHVVHADDIILAGIEWVYAEYDSVRPKFDSVAAAILWTWSLDSAQDETSGDAQCGNGWHALFRSERAILREDNGGFVDAWRIEDGADVDAYWAGIEAGAVYPDDDTEACDDCTEDQACPEHCDCGDC